MPSADPITSITNSYGPSPIKYQPLLSYTYQPWAIAIMIWSQSQISHILRYIAIAPQQKKCNCSWAVLTEYPASSSRNAQLSQLVSHCPSDFQSSPVDQILDVREFPFLDEDFVPRVGKVERIWPKFTITQRLYPLNHYPPFSGPLIKRIERGDF